MIAISKATPADVNGIIKIHLAAFAGFFLSSLGHHFLSVYYSTFIKSGLGIVYCAKKNNTIIGFSACSYISRGFNASLIKKFLFSYTVEAIRLLFTKPKSIIRLAKNLNKKSDDISMKDNGEYAELYSIAVSPSCQGEGVGRLLLMATERDVSVHNDTISLTTDFYNNDNTIGFYHTLGYHDLYVFDAYPDRKMWRMIKSLKKEEYNVI